MNQEVLNVAIQARAASDAAAMLTTEQKNQFLSTAAKLLEASVADIVSANEKDLANGKTKGLNAAMLDRLLLNESRIKGMANALREIVNLPDPVGVIQKDYQRPNGLQIKKIRIPLGVIGIIYESRPNVTVDAAALCLKSGNVVVLRGGSEAFNSNIKLCALLQQALSDVGLNPHLIQIIPTADRESVYDLMKLDQYIDLIIPRGGPALMQMVREHSKIPVIKHDKGVCHLYIDGEANLQNALAIAINGKVQRPGVCNALETILVDKSLQDNFLKELVSKLQSLGVTIHGCEQTQKVNAQVQAASEADWDKEYLELIVNLKVVDDINAAIAHIRKHNSLHTEAIVTDNKSKADLFIRSLNSSAIMVNASTRFNDGGELGLGAEIGISTSKLHAFGPMGLEELTTTKFVVLGDGQVRG